MGGTPYHRLKELTNKELSREAVTDMLDAWVKIDMIETKKLKPRSQRLIRLALDSLQDATDDFQAAQSKEKWDYRNEKDPYEDWGDDV